jgi:hypothetical protein
VSGGTGQSNATFLHHLIELCLSSAILDLVKYSRNVAHEINSLSVREAITIQPEGPNSSRRSPGNITDLGYRGKTTSRGAIILMNCRPEKGMVN